MLADEAVEAALLGLGGRRGRVAGRGDGGGDVALRAARAVGTRAGLEGAAYRAVGGQTDLVCLAEEGREAEAVGGCGVVEDGGGGGLGGRRGGHGGRFGCPEACLAVVPQFAIDAVAVECLAIALYRCVGCEAVVAEWWYGEKMTVCWEAGGSSVEARLGGVTLVPGSGLCQHPTNKVRTLHFVLVSGNVHLPYPIYRLVLIRR